MTESSPGRATVTRAEIERKFLLNGMPPVPQGAETWRIHQGYFDAISMADAATRDRIIGGRLRSIETSDGSVHYIHTMKTGVGVVRQETERELTREEFMRHWPRTINRRLTKTRYRVPEADLVWEIDQFDSLGLVLLEVELPSADHPVVVPAWLKPFLVSEVTNDPSYTNASLATLGKPKALPRSSPA